MATNGTKVPHTLRLMIFFLRLALGVNFFYVGFTTLFNATLENQLRGQSLGDIYAWLNGSASTGSFHVFLEWAFLVVGAGLILGFATRLVSLGGMALVLASTVPAALASLTPYALVSNEVVTFFCLLVLIFADAGVYLGLDMFIHIHFSSKHEKK